MEADCSGGWSSSWAVVLRGRMYPCKWNHASLEKNVNYGLISPLMTNCRNQLQKRTVLADRKTARHGLLLFYRDWATAIVLHFVHLIFKLQPLELCALVISRCTFKPGFYAIKLLHSKCCLCFCFLSINSFVDLSLFTKLWIACLLGTRSPQNIG